MVDSDRVCWCVSSTFLNEESSQRRFAGTFLGELACFFVFKYFLTARAQKWALSQLGLVAVLIYDSDRIEDERVFYACLARLMRDGGIGVVILMRYSAVPGHVVTAVQVRLALCDCR